MLVSSANIDACVVSKQFGKSIMYIRKSCVPRLDPWGTPHAVILTFGSDWLILHICFRSLR